jgi:RNA-directed DNA polymerase
MYLQRWILRYVLSSARIHPCSYAYQSAKSISDCASAHLGAEWLVKVDIRQFFESISEIQVFRIFESLGYGKLISMEMARLTTRLVPARSSRAKEPNWQAWQTQRYNIACYKTVLQGALPQGAPTSPMLSNIAMYGCDVDVAREADALGWAYTRYSDDLIFSTRRAGTTRSDAEELIKLAYRKMNATGLRPHQAKSVIAPPGARKVVLGLLVDGNQLRLRKDFRKSLECHVHYIKTLGPVKHAERRGFRSISGMKAYVFGLIAFAESIDKDFALRIRQSLCNVSWPT